MKSSKGQVTAILILILALFLQMEGMIPNIFAGDKEPIVLLDELDGLEFMAELDGNSLGDENDVVIKATVTNKGTSSINYYAGTTSIGIRAVMGAALYSMEGKSAFTDKLEMEALKQTSDAMALEGQLEPGRALRCDFNMLPFYMENGTVKKIEPGKYILKLWYNKGAQETVKAEFPINVVKRFGKIYIKS